MNKTVGTIAGDFDLKRYQSLRKLYNKVSKEASKVTTLKPEPGIVGFKFEGHDMLLDFAKLILELLDPHFKHIR